MRTALRNKGKIMNTKKILEFIREQEINDMPISVWQLPNGMFKYEHIDNISRDKRNIQTGLTEYKEKLGYYKKDAHDSITSV